MQHLTRPSPLTPLRSTSPPPELVEQWFDAITNGKDIETAKAVLQRLASSSVRRGLLNRPDASGHAAAFHAVSQQNQPLLHSLLSWRADPNVEDNHRNTPLHEACRLPHTRSNMRLVRLLIDYGADINRRNDVGQLCYETRTPFVAPVMDDSLKEPVADDQPVANIEMFVKMCADRKPNHVQHDVGDLGPSSPLPLRPTPLDHPDQTTSAARRSSSADQTDTKAPSAVPPAKRTVSFLLPEHGDSNGSTPSSSVSVDAPGASKRSSVYSFSTSSTAHAPPSAPSSSSSASSGARRSSSASSGSSAASAKPWRVAPRSPVAHLQAQSLSAQADEPLDDKWIHRGGFRIQSPLQLPANTLPRILTLTRNALRRWHVAIESNLHEISKRIKESLDAEFSPSWHVVVGFSFGSKVVHTQHGFLYMEVDIRQRTEQDSASAATTTPQDESVDHTCADPYSLPLAILMFRI